MSTSHFSPGILSVVQEKLSAAFQKFQGLFSHRDFVSGQSLLHTPGVDPLLLPRALMDSDNLDVSTLNELGRMGMRRGKEITAASHPELYRAWATMCVRAGQKHVPQLILTESNSINAMAISPEEVAVTTGLFKQLTFREVCAVLGHEAAHEASDHTKPRLRAIVGFGGAGLLAGSWFSHRGGVGAFMNHGIANPGPVRRAMAWVFGDGSRHSSIVATAIYTWAAMGLGSIVANQVSVRPTELDADRKSVMISGDPEGLISALGKLEEARGERTLWQRFKHFKSGYPSIATRIEQLREIARTMPTTTPVVATIVPEQPFMTAAAGTPVAQVHGVALAGERVGTLVPEPVAAL